MGFYAKRTALGIREVSEGSSDSEKDFYVSTVEEYDQLQAYLQEIRSRAERSAAEAEHQISDLKASLVQVDEQRKCDTLAAQEVIDALKNQVADRDHRIAELTASLAKRSSELSNQVDLNKNLLRIARERANALRGIHPKKEHDGYLVMNSQQYRQTYTVNVPDSGYETQDLQWLITNKRLHTERRSASIWKSVVQTPFDASIPLKDIEDQVFQAFIDGEVLHDIGCTGIVAPEENGRFRANWAAADTEDNILYRWRFIADFRSGFWEAECYTTKALHVSRDRRLPSLAAKTPSLKNKTGDAVLQNQKRSIPDKPAKKSRRFNL